MLRIEKMVVLYSALRSERRTQLTFAKDDPNYAHVLWYGWEQTWSLNELPNALILCSDIPWVDADGERFEAEGELFGWWKAGPSYWAVWSQDQIDGIAENGFSSNLSTLAAGNQGLMPGNMPVPEIYDVLDKLVALCGQGRYL